MKTLIILLMACGHWQRSQHANAAPGLVLYCVQCRKREAVAGTCSPHQLWAEVP